MSRSGRNQRQVFAGDNQALGGSLRRPRANRYRLHRRGSRTRIRRPDNPRDSRRCTERRVTSLA
jgi:hypothetical protein